MPARSSAWSASTGYERQPSTVRLLPRIARVLRAVDAVATVDEDRLAVGCRREPVGVVVRLVREEDGVPAEHRAPTANRTRSEV